MTNVEFLQQLFDRLWEAYRARVTYVRDYEQVVASTGATFLNDHIAFRSIAWQQPSAGISSISRPFEALGYRPAACYHFPDKHLQAIHLEPPIEEPPEQRSLPKLFVSELQAWKLDESSRNHLAHSLNHHRPPLSIDLFDQLARIDSTDQRSENLETLVAWFLQRPWPAPGRSDVESLAEISQYAAWVLVHGYAVNHFTGLVNAHGVEPLATIEKTVARLQAAGVPMKSDIEGVAGSRLRQTATEAVVVDVDITEAGQPASMPWTYAYFELAERGEVIDPATGEPSRFEGFLGPQATQLFDMTRRS
jgi:hypothetical protein